MQSMSNDGQICCKSYLHELSQWNISEKIRLTDKEDEKLVPKIMVYYLDSLVKSNTDWQKAMEESLKRMRMKENVE